MLNTGSSVYTTQLVKHHKTWRNYKSLLFKETYCFIRFVDNIINTSGNSKTLRVKNNTQIWHKVHQYNIIQSVQIKSIMCFSAKSKLEYISKCSASECYNGTKTQNPPKLYCNGMFSLQNIIRSSVKRGINIWE